MILVTATVVQYLSRDVEARMEHRTLAVRCQPNLARQPCKTLHIDSAGDSALSSAAR